MKFPVMRYITNLLIKKNHEMRNFLKKKSNWSKIIATFALLLFVVTYACRQEIWEDPLTSVDAPKAIENAKAWYEVNKPEETVLRSSGNNGMGQMKVKAEWSHAFATRYDTLEVVETDVMSLGLLQYLDPECVAKYNETKDPKYEQSYTRMVFRTNKKTGETVGFLMTISPNLDWLEKSKFKPFHDVTYLFRSNQFGGLVLFHNIDGSFSNGWRYEKGKIVAEISSFDVDPNQVLLRSTTCVTVYYHLVYYDCYDVYYQYSYEDEYLDHSFCITTELPGSYTECYDIPDPPTPPPGGGGYTGNSSVPGVSSTIAALTKKISLPNNAITSLNAIMDQLINEYPCGYPMLYSYLLSKGGKFSDIYINTLGNPGTYDPATKALTFNSLGSISSAFPEEFIHLFQDYYYSGGINQYNGTTGHNNIEFENKLLQDLLCRIYVNTSAIPTHGCYYYGAGKQYRDYYFNWLTNLLAATNNKIPTVAQLNQMRPITNGTTTLNCNYLFFMQDFNAANGNLPLNYYLNPGAFEYITDHSGCK